MTDSGGISRRKALQKIGVGAVVVWSAPMVTSVASAAPVGSPMPGCQTFDCSVSVPCPGNASCFGPYRTANGGCSCVGNTAQCVSSCADCFSPQICVNQVVNCDCPALCLGACA